MARFDLTIPYGPATPPFPGDSPISFTRVEAARPWHVTITTAGSHIGTHMDAPLHRLPDGRTIDTFGPDRWFGEAVIIPVPSAQEDTPIPASVLDAIPVHLLRGRFALLRTGWDSRIDGPAYFRNPWPSEELAHALIDAGTTLLGLDAPNVDSSVAGSDVIHRILFGAEMLLVENLCGLDRLPAGMPIGACFAPIPYVGGDGAPVRAIAWDLA